MRDDDGTPTISDFFVRWKKHVDHHIGTTLNGVFGIPSVVSRTWTWDGADANTQHVAAIRPAKATSGGDSSISTGGSDGVLPQDAVLMRQWYNWTVNSPYSPWNLQYIPQPVPNDLPSDMDFSPGGFADAFEDLLRASSEPTGYSMADHRERKDRFRNDRVANRAVDPRVLWLTGLRTEGLLGAAYPPATPGREILGKPLGDASALSYYRGGGDTRIAWLDKLRQQRWYDFYFPQHTSLAFRSPAGTFGWWAQEEWPAPDRQPEGISSSWDWKTEARRVFRDASEYHWKPSQQQTDDQKNWQRNGAVDEKRKEGREPETEEELASFVQSTTPKDKTDDRWSVETSEKEESLEPGKHLKSSRKTRNPDGTTTVTTREDYMDKQGNKRVKVVSHTYDENGDEISVQNSQSWSYSFSMGTRPDEEKKNAQAAAKWSHWSQKPPQDQADDEKASKGKSKKDGGGSWFWR